MARLQTAGAEANDQFAHADGFDVSVASVGSGIARTGIYSYKCDSLGGAFGAFVIDNMSAVQAVISGRTYYSRAYLRFTDLPDSTVEVAYLGVATGGRVRARLTSGGALQAWTDSAQFGSNSAETIVANDGKWHRIELAVTYQSAGDDTYEVRLNGVTVASATGPLVAVNTWNTAWGWNESPGASKVCYVDDIAINDSTGSAQNSWPGEGGSVLLLPISDNTRTNWTAGAGGITNLWDAINNEPPVGLASASETNTSNIESGSNTGTATYIANMATPASAGIAAGDTINAAQILIAHGEDIATGSKTGSVECTANPVIASSTFTFGDDAGAHAGYPGAWRVKLVSSSSPTIVVSTNPTVKVIKTDTTTRVGCVCFVGMYVEYVSVVAFQDYDRPYGSRGARQMQQLMAA